MDRIPCPDGYLLDADSPLAAGHHALNQYLVRVEEAGWKPAAQELNALRDKKLKVQVIHALFERLAWLHAAKPEGPWFRQLHDLTYSIEKWKLAPSEADLLRLLESNGCAAAFVMPYCVMPHVMAWVEEHGLKQALSTAIREFGARVRDAQYTVNQTSWQLLNSRLDMLAWRDEWDGLELKRCWSERVRAEFRAMEGAARDRWRGVLYSIGGDQGVRPSPRWLKESRERMRVIGAREFASRLLGWLEPLRPGTTHPLSREGSHILRAFIWLAQLPGDPVLAAASAGIAEVEFKPKRNGEKVLRAAAETAGRPDPAPPRPQPMPGLDELTARALRAALDPRGSPMAAGIAGRVIVEGGLVLVRGDLDTYRVHISTGAVFRLSDGSRVSVALEMTPGLPDIGGTGELLATVLALVRDASDPSAIAAIPD
jgi:hypothetical protein